MKVNKDDLVKKLKLLNSGRNKDMVDSPDYIIEQFILTKTHAIVQNEEVCMMVPVHTGIKKGAVGFPEELLGVIKGMDSDKIAIRVNETKSNAFIKGDKAKAQIRVKIGVTVRKPDVSKWTTLPKDFTKAIDVCRTTSSETGKHDFETCLSVDGKHIVSTDTYRVSQYNLSRSMKKMTIPVKYAAAVAKMEPTKYYMDDDQLYFTNDADVILAVRRLNIIFPPCGDMFEETGDLIELPDNFGDIVESALAFSKVDDEDVSAVVDIIMGPDGIKCRSDNDRGWIEIPLEVDLKMKKEVEFRVNPSFFLQILEDAESVLVSKDGIMFNTPNYKQVLALVNK